jgi:hypothetical protein
MQTFSISLLILAPFEQFMDNFVISYPFKGARAWYACLFWFDSSSAHWVDAEWDSLSTESMQSETTCQLSQLGVRLHINWVNAEDTNIDEDFIIPRWLSCRGVSLRVDSVDMKSHLALIQLTGMSLDANWVIAECKKIFLSQRIQVQNWKHSKALLFGLYMFDQCKKPEQKYLMQVYL